jgi:hypothetical protein
MSKSLKEDRIEELRDIVFDKIYNAMDSIANDGAKELEEDGIIQTKERNAVEDYMGFIIEYMKDADTCDIELKL